MQLGFLFGLFSLPGLTITDEYQLMRWGCKVLFDSWNLLKLVHKQTKCLLGPEVISTLIDKNLVGIATFVQKKKSNEVNNFLQYMA